MEAKIVDWSAISNRSITGKLFRLPLKILPSSMVIRIIQGPCRGMKWVVGSSIHGCWLGSYEIHKQRAIARFIKPDMTVYDIGAHAGFYSLLFSRLVGPKGKVLAFEPFAENAANLLRHIHLNRLQNVALIQAALADQSGLSFFTAPKYNSMGSMTRTHTRLRVPTFSLDELVTKLDFPIPDIIKVDVEGAEAAILKGARTLIGLRKTIIFIALHGNEQKRLCQNILTESGYELFWIHGNKVEGKLQDFQDDEIYACPIELR